MTILCLFFLGVLETVMLTHLVFASVSLGCMVENSRVQTRMVAWGFGCCGGKTFVEITGPLNAHVDTATLQRPKRCVEDGLTPISTNLSRERGGQMERKQDG